MIGFSSSFMSFKYVWSYRQNFFSLWNCTPDCLCRDGGLKREKVKDTFKEEQQKLYSKMLVGTQEDRSRSWGYSQQVDWLRDRSGRRWLSRQTAVTRQVEPLHRIVLSLMSTILHLASPVTASAWHVKLHHCCGIFAQPTPSPPRWNSSIKALLAVEKEGPAWRERLPLVSFFFFRGGNK